jgi:putative peptidoglycan lipid II flippase
MLRSLATVSGFTLMSRLLGFLRDILIGNYLGVGAAADAWAQAFSFPNLFRRIFGEGAFNSAFVPLYSRVLEQEGEGEADGFASLTLSWMSYVLIVLAATMWLAAEGVVGVLVPGFRADEAKFALTVELMRVTVPYLVLVCLVAGLSGVLNSRKFFASAAFSQVVLNIVLVGALLLVVPRVEVGARTHVLAWGLLVAGVMQVAVVAYGCRQAKVRLRLVPPRRSERVVRLVWLMVPGVIGAGVQQINLLVSRAVTSFQDGGNAVVYYADRINQLPLGLVGIAFGVVLLPEISRRLRGGDEEGALRSLVRGLEMSLLLTVPAAVAMVAIAVPIMHVLFFGGEFRAEASVQAGQALGAFAFGLPAYVLVRVLQPGFYAREDTRTPMWYTGACATVNGALCAAVFFSPLREMGLLHLGAAAATSVAGWVNVWLLVRGLGARGHLSWPPGLFRTLGKILLASLVMGLVVWGLAELLEGQLMGEKSGATARLGRVGILLGVVGVGMGVYFGLVFRMGVANIGKLRGAFRR